MFATRLVVSSLLVASLVSGAGGCSFVGLDRLAGGYQPHATPRCSTSVVLPIADVIAGSAAAIVTGVLVEEESEPDAEDWAVIAIPAVASVALYASALYGWRQVVRCHAGRDAHDRWLAPRRGVAPTPATGADDAR